MQPKIANKISKIKSYLLIIDEMKSECENKFLKDPIYQGALLHYLYLISDECVVLAKMICKDILNKMNDVKQYISYIKG